MPGSYTAARSFTVTTTVKPVKAKCEENQDGLNRLQEVLVKAQSNGNVNYSFTLSRAIKSLKDCAEPIRSQKDACKLKFIGPSIAKVICPLYTTSSASKPSPASSGTETNTQTNNNTKKRKAAATTAATASAIVAPAKKPAPSSEPTEFVLSTKQKTYNKAKQDAENLILPRNGPWKVILLVDGREQKSQQVVSCCKQSGIPCEERHLPIGDMAWIARCEKPKDESNPLKKPLEIMIGTIIERKEVADLASSLYGTRYNEQRLRLSQCGLPQVLFLVEGDLTTCANCPAETLQMAMMETRIQLGFQIIQTKHLTDTVRVLKGLHRRIVQRAFPDAFAISTGVGVPTYNDNPHDGPRNESGRQRRRRPTSLLEMVFDTNPVVPFGTTRFITYPELKAKVELDREQGTRTVRAITLAMLKQIPSLSQKKCTAIARDYPTFNRLVEAMCYSESDPVKLVSGIEIERRTIGPKSAQEVHDACCTLGDGSVVSSHSKPPAGKAKAAATKKAAGKPPRQTIQSSSASTALPKKKNVASSTSSSSIAGKRGSGGVSSPIVLDSPSPPPKKQKARAAAAAANGRVIDLSTPSVAAAAAKDPAGWSTDTASTKQATSTARGKENNNQRKTCSSSICFETE